MAIMMVHVLLTKERNYEDDADVEGGSMVCVWWWGGAAP